MRDGVSVCVEGPRVVVTCTGSYTVAELRRAWSEAADDFPARPSVLLDIRGSDSVLKRSTKDLRAIAWYFSAELEKHRARCAILVAGVARYGLMRMAATWAEREGVRVAVFRSVAAAEGWLAGEGEPLTSDPRL